MSGNSSTASLSPVIPSNIAAGQSQQGISLVTFASALTTSLVVFAVQLIAFLLLRNKLARIFKPKTYLVPEKERTEPPPRTPWGWLFALFKFRDREIIRKCGLDAYFFSRYLRTLLVIFTPLALVLIPTLIPLNYIGGRGSSYRQEIINKTNATNANNTLALNVKGLDSVAWGNIRPSKTHRYWAHLILAIIVIIWVCGVFFSELRIYTRVRQDHLTSAEHRLRASATTVLVSAIPKKWLTEEALAGLYDVFPGGIRNIWINRNFDELSTKIHERDQVFRLLESAETELIQLAKKSSRKQARKDEILAAKNAKCKLRMTKKDRQQKVMDENAQADQLVQSGGQSTGDLPQSIGDTIAEQEKKSRRRFGHQSKRSLNIPKISVVSQGIGRGLGSFSKASEIVGRNIEAQLETSDGFMNIEDLPLGDDEYDQFGRFRGQASSTTQRDESMREAQDDVEDDAGPSPTTGPVVGNLEKVSQRQKYNPESSTGDEPPRNKWWEFWKPPSGGFGTPTPTGYEPSDSHTLDKAKKNPSSVKNASVSEKINHFLRKVIPFLGSDEEPREKYPPAFNSNYVMETRGAAWEKYLKAKDRPTHRLHIFDWTPSWFPTFPIINKKVDTIYWCRKQLARLNLEIEIDQKHPEKFPLMNSAFIQFNHQVAAHMACQSVSYHVPKQMAPRTVEVSPKDVIWDNMSIKWWEAWMRTAIVIGVVVGMLILWAFPVAWTASLAQLSDLANKYPFLHCVKAIPTNYVQAVAGVLPAIVLGLLLTLIPIIFKYLAFLQGAQTGTEQQSIMQIYYFTFLFVQVFLVVSISGGTLATITSATNIKTIPDTLATQLPKAANYFFSYMILQALSTSSGGLLQIMTLLQWYIWPKLVDNTAREKWTRNTTLPSVTWGTFFPVYTNFACIALVYCIVAPVIVVFAIITFSLLWVAQRYNMLYVSRFEIDTGGLLYPRAINQTFTGLYVMELCLVGLFFLVADENGKQACVPQAIIMSVFVFLTVIYQFLLNKSFGPLLHHLPITFENEAVLRDQAFERAQARRLGLVMDEADDMGLPQSNRTSVTHEHHEEGAPKFKSSKIVQEAGSWALRSGKHFTSKALGHCSGHGETEENTILNSNCLNNTSVRPSRRVRRHRDLEAQRKIADALYGGYNDDIEDLTPEERNVLVNHAFQHSALRARRPTVWIPRDDIGVSDDEIKRTREFAGNNIWISNIGAALDGNSRVVYGRNPPDFSEVDLIDL
ncbi:Bgt-913 [Blumeria graminis f. sp. tritici]|uniref:Bgt-913 n=2 Tax=Blumeria graminis f. sp. tritici TaxID=62690 RepID=A0A061HNS4_BLUGR|nr:hypothetical protein BGT96224_913 [Blumeria graminis f. sp. tritici 96224]VCU38935.1 Bgt-913 [Blumeria graminis f. sp. tritici]